MTHPELLNETVGSLDLGAQALLIAFLAGKDPGMDFIKMTPILSRTYAIYARGYLCLGFEEAMRRWLAYLVMVITPVYVHYIYIKYCGRKGCTHIYM